MAQGSLKKKTKTALPPTKNKPQKPKNTSRVAKPAKAKATSYGRATKKFTAGLAARTEQLLGERAGHLELVGKGKKTAEKDKVGHKGGSKKFG